MNITVKKTTPEQITIKTIKKCFHSCPYFEIEAGMTKAMICTNKEAPYKHIISHPECDNGFPKLCPLIKEEIKK